MEGFTYSVAHDLRAPLRAIISTSRILIEEAGGKLDPEDRRLLERQAHNANRLGTLIDDLLKMSRISREEMRLEPFDLSALAEGLAREMERDGRAGAGQIVVQPGLNARGDSRLIRLALQNLFENAAKFSPGGGSIHVGRVADGAYYVRDSGIGFDMQFVNRLFRPFERLVSDDQFSGTGIGLANVNRVIQRHGGRVWAESELGKGATFFFTLP
jgi:signal transduction histidine kinase